MKRRRRAKTGGNPIYFFKEGIVNIFLNGFMSFAAVSIITICLLVVGCFSLIALNAKEQIAKEVSRSEIVIFIEEEYLMSTILDDLEEIAILEEQEALENLSEEESEQTDTDSLSDAVISDENTEEEIEEPEDTMTEGQVAYISQFNQSEKTADDYADIEEQILKVIDVAGVKFTSKEESLESYKETLGSEAFILEGFEDDNPLRDGYIVYLNSLQFVDEVTEGLNEIDGIAEVSSRNETYKALYNIEKGFNILSVVFLVAFGAVSIFIISNTVKLAMFARKEEIAIMKMIGAKDAFIKWPFIIEGLILGIVAAGIAFGVTWFVYIETIQFMSEFIGFIDIIAFDSILMYVLYLYIAVGAIIGVFGSLSTIKKFLDV